MIDTINTSRDHPRNAACHGRIWSDHWFGRKRSYSDHRHPFPSVWPDSTAGRAVSLYSECAAIFTADFASRQNRLGSWAASRSKPALVEDAEEQAYGSADDWGLAAVEARRSAADVGRGTGVSAHTYDVLNRLIGRQYSDGSTPAAGWFYDMAGVAYGKGPPGSNE